MELNARRYQVCASGRESARAAQLAERQRPFDDSRSAHSTVFIWDRHAARGGLLVDDLVGIACESIGDSGSDPSIKELDARRCRELVVALQNVDEHRRHLTM